MLCPCAAAKPRDEPLQWVRIRDCKYEPVELYVPFCMAREAAALDCCRTSP